MFETNRLSAISFFCKLNHDKRCMINVMDRNISLKSFRSSAWEKDVRNTGFTISLFSLLVEVCNAERRLMGKTKESVTKQIYWLQRRCRLYITDPSVVNGRWSIRAWINHTMTSKHLLTECDNLAGLRLGYFDGSNPNTLKLILEEMKWTQTQ